ncbi:MAG: winged helix-turn-helix transcriptional regulator [Phycisphaerae bacterium]|nr:winged helix-turn-helix transcriptional regulator [Phycisphaerae bacterium]
MRKDQAVPDAFTALADPTRRAILVMLSGRQLPAAAIAAGFPQQRPAISKHLAILQRAGLIEQARDRQRRLYSIKARAFESIASLLSSLHPAAASKRPPLKSRAPAHLPSSSADVAPPSPQFDPEID